MGGFTHLVDHALGGRVLRSRSRDSRWGGKPWGISRHQNFRRANLACDRSFLRDDGSRMLGALLCFALLCFLKHPHTLVPPAPQRYGMDGVDVAKPGHMLCFSKLFWSSAIGSDV